MNIHKTKSEEIARLAKILKKEGWEVSSITIDPPVRADILPGGSILKIKASPAPALTPKTTPTGLQV
jgi:hypothetical protein